MKKQYVEPYHLLQATAGNWRNAIFIACTSCPYGRETLCPGFLLTADADGAPLILSAELLGRQIGQQLDKDECAAVLSRSAFESAYGLWLKWQIDNPQQCALLQLTL